MSLLQKLFPGEAFHRETKAGDKVPLVQKLAIGVGEIPGIGHRVIANLALPVFNLALGLSPVGIGIVLGLTRLWDAITDPVAGSLADNTETRFGRRRPYLFFSSVICGLMLALVFMAPGEWGSRAIFIYFLTIALIFYTSYSFFNIPMMAIAWEITPDYHERSRVIAYKIFFSIIADLMAQWVLALSTLAIFGGIVTGARVTSWVAAGLMIVTGLIPAYLVKEGNLKIALREKRLKFVNSVREALKNKPFLIFCGIASVKDITQIMVDSLGLYVSIFFVFNGDIEKAALMKGAAGTVSIVMTMLLLPVITMYITRRSKKQVLGISISVLALVSASKWVLYHPNWPWMIVVHSVLMTPPLVVLRIVTSSMMADICDYDEWKTSSRREGIYASVHSWIEKAMGSVAIILSGFVLVMTGFEQSLPAQSESTLFNMRLIFVGVPTLGLVVSLIFVKLFPITQERSFEIRQELEARRGTDYEGTVSALERSRQSEAPKGG